jgi:carbonic anhydrase/acetyltransferase-like protein (isoleucine patch superfamily)
MGRPAKAVRDLTEKEMSYFSYSAANYVKLKDEHLAEDWAT